MPELSVTEEQLERIETVRTGLEAAFLDGYGHMRRHDAIEYLLDTYTPPGSDGSGSGVPIPESEDEASVEERVRDALDREVRDEEGDIDYPTLQSVARDTDGVKGSGMSAEEMYEAVVEAKARELEAGETDEIDVSVDEEEKVETDDTDDVEGEAGPEEAEEADATDEGDEASDGEPSETDAGEEASNGSATATSGGGGGSQLQAMMNLLKTHDDRWRKASSGDAPYEVDLPDGGTESARTKDDVKRILFTNY